MEDSDELYSMKGPVAVNRREVGLIEEECRRKWLREKRDKKKADKDKDKGEWYALWR